VKSIHLVYLASEFVVFTWIIRKLYANAFNLPKWPIVWFVVTSLVQLAVAAWEWCLQPIHETGIRVEHSQVLGILLFVQALIPLRIVAISVEQREGRGQYDV